MAREYDYSVRLVYDPECEDWPLDRMPMRRAIRITRDIHTIIQLLDAGYDPNRCEYIADHKDRTPADAGYEHDCSLPPIFLAFSSWYKSSTYEREGIAIAQLLIEYGADINSRSNDDSTPLHLSCGYRGCLRYVRWMLDNGAEIEAKRLRFTDERNKDHELLFQPSPQSSSKFVRTHTPLQDACRYGQVDIMRELLDRGARVHCLFVLDPKHRGPVVGLLRKYFAIVVRMHVVGPSPSDDDDTVTDGDDAAGRRFEVLRTLVPSIVSFLI